MAFIYSLADTWADGATTFKGISLNVTDSASAAGSLLMDLQVGGVSRFRVDKTGSVTSLADIFGGGQVGVTSSRVWSNGVTTTGYFGIASANPLSPDTILTRDAANTLAQRNGVNPQAFNLYNTYTDASNYNRASMYFSGGAFFIDNDLNAGTGITNASLWIKSRGNVYLSPGAGGYDVVTNNNGAGSLYPGGTTNTTNLGRSDKAFALGYFGTAVILGGYHQMTEMTAPAAPAANNVRIYAEDDGAGKTRLMARFATGAAVQIAIEP